MISSEALASLSCRLHVSHKSISMISATQRMVPKHSMASNTQSNCLKEAPLRHARLLLSRTSNMKPKHSVAILAFLRLERLFSRMLFLMGTCERVGPDFQPLNRHPKRRIWKPLLIVLLLFIRARDEPTEVVIIVLQSRSY